MPELPDITLYQHALACRVKGRTLTNISIRSPFVLRTFDPPIDSAERRRVTDVRRLGKRLVLAMDGDLFIIIHLMIAGRFRWADGAVKGAAKGKIDLARFDFENGALTLTEASQQKRAGVWLVSGDAALRTHDRGGLDLFACSPAEFAARLRSQRRTVKRAITDPSVIDGVGNAYSDEILHAAGMSPTTLTTSPDDAAMSSLLDACRRTLTHWTDTLLREFGYVNGAVGRFPGPGEVTAFRPDFAVHGKYGKPCPVCGAKVQRIVYASNETNYCPACQCRGVILKDRSLSRLLRDDWPSHVDDVE